jgi:hypothetical protein
MSHGSVVSWRILTPADATSNQSSYAIPRASTVANGIIGSAIFGIYLSHRANMKTVFRAVLSRDEAAVVFLHNRL